MIPDKDVYLNNIEIQEVKSELDDNHFVRVAIDIPFYNWKAIQESVCYQQMVELLISQNKNTLLHNSGLQCEKGKSLFELYP